MIKATDVEDAVDKIQDIVEPNDVVLLSQLVQVGISIIHLKNVVRSLSIDSEALAIILSVNAHGREKINLIRRICRIKNDNATHLNDSQRNEDLELLDGIKSSLKRRRRRIDNQSKEKDATSTQSQLETKPMDKFIDNHKSHNQDKEIKSDLIEDNVNDENDNQKNINDKLNDRIVKKQMKVVKVLKTMRNFYLSIGVNNNLKASRHSKSINY